MKVKVEIRQIDAWMDTVGEWYWNDSTVIDTTEFDTDKFFDEQFKKYMTDKFTGLVTAEYIDKNYYFDTHCDGLVEMCVKKTGLPLFAAIPLED